MLFKSALLALPLLASAVPTKRDQLVFGDNEVHSLAESSKELVGDINLDLNELRLVQFGQDEVPVWISEWEKIEAKVAGKKFFDITDTPTLGLTTFLAPSGGPKKYGKHPSVTIAESRIPQTRKAIKAIKKMHETLDIDHMRAFLTKFSGFRTRYYRSETGKQSQHFLYQTIQEIASKSDANITMREFAHPWGQNSIIVRFEPSTESKNAPTVVIGAHQDSTNQFPFLPAPGADDDGSGTTSSLEGLKALAHANFTPSLPVEFHYFSAEEGGLLGSQAIAKSYEEEGRKVLAMLQMDMTAWVKKGTEERVGIIQDFVDPALTSFIEELIAEYLDIPAVKTQCGYACSDHASFGKAGYQSAFAIESSFEDSNHNIHTSQDTMNHPEFSFDHMKQFSKMVVAFAVELGNSKQ